MGVFGLFSNRRPRMAELSARPPARRPRGRLPLRIAVLALVSLAVVLVAIVVDSRPLGSDADVRAGSTLSPTPTPPKPSPSIIEPDVIVTTFSVSDDMSMAEVGLENASGVTFTASNGNLQAGTDGSLAIPLGFASATQPVSVSVSVQGFPQDVMRVDYYPAAYYASVGVDSEGAIDLFTTLPRADNKNRVELISPPTSASLVVDAATWQAIRAQRDFAPKGIDLDEQIRELYLQFDQLNGQSDSECGTSLDGATTFHDVAAGQCSVWCTGYARMTRDFLRSVNVPARYIALGGPYVYLPDGVLVESSESHDTTDMWVGGTWQWVDATFRVLRATGPDGKVLTLDGVMQLLSDQATRGEISFTRLDPSSEQWKTLTYEQEDDAFKQDLASFLSADKKMIIGNEGAG